MRREGHMRARMTQEAVRTYWKGSSFTTGAGIAVPLPFLMLRIVARERHPSVTIGITLTRR